MTESALTVTLKAGGGYEAPWLVIRADTPEQLTQRLDAVIEKGIDAAVILAAQSLAREWGGNTAPAVSGQANVESTLGGQVVQDTPGFTSAPQQPAAPAPAAPSGGLAPICQHGAMNYKSGEKNGRTWQAYMCPTPKGTPDQCSPQWVK